MTRGRWNAALSLLGASVLLSAVAAQAQPPRPGMAPIELTTQSLVKVEWDSSQTLSLVAQNAPVEQVIREILAKTGWKPKLPPVIRGRTTRQASRAKPGPLLSSIAVNNELEIRFAPDGTPTEIYPTLQTRDVYSLTGEQRLAASKTSISPTVPATGIATGYVIYRGHYIPPPYQVTKARVGLFHWEVRINGLTCDKVMTSPPPDWKRELPPNGQLDDPVLISRYCARLWQEWEAAGKSYERIRSDIGRFLGTQREIKSFEWVGKYAIRYVSKTDSWTHIVLSTPQHNKGAKIEIDVRAIIEEHRGNCSCGGCCDGAWAQDQSGREVDGGRAG